MTLEEDIVEGLEELNMFPSEIDEILEMIRDRGYKIVEDNDARPDVHGQRLAEELWSVYRTPVVVGQHGNGKVYVRAFGA